MSTRKIAAIYSRVSTAAQSGPNKSSLDSQLAECLAEARRQGYEVPEHLQFQDVMSGRRDDRPDFLRLMAAGRRREFDCLFIWSVDRIGRTLRAAVNAVGDLKDVGITTYTVKEGDLNDTIRLGVLIAIAAREIERMGERTIPPKERQRAAGVFVNGQAPFGYRKRADKSLEKCPGEADVVRRIFRSCTTGGMGRTQIARSLNQDRVPPPEVKVVLPDGTTRRMRPALIEADGGVGAFTAWLEKNGARVDGIPEWQSRTVARVLDNSAACGWLWAAERKDKDGNPVPKRETVKLVIHGGPIVTESEFNDAAKAKETRREPGRRPGRRPVTPWLLVSKIVCGSCGKNYFHTDSKGVHYYVCHARKTGKLCKGPYLQMVKVDNEVKAAVKGFIENRIGGPAKIRELVMGQSLRDRRQLTQNIEEKEAELARAEMVWKEKQAILGRLDEMEVERASIPDLVADNDRARAERQRAASALSALMDQKSLLDTGVIVSGAELDKIVNRIEAGMRSMTATEAGEGQDSDVVFVVKALVDQVVVNPDRTLSIRLVDDPAAVARVFAEMLRSAVGDVRQVQAIGGRVPIPEM
ncbi:hypothetical protein H261_08283 [Paramagnetospirillum caucaseum]|uniref:Recombinase domain-containing protein n=1 Tax=Paramagnetospirillum caucaseum TaxID=1244869 RepID=M2Z824_9PROT|nr:recombinase family protein [Paramagnetospirillum caucaseum]EME70465.1 hypothetical protein H261_08283 [Paramagnetospirillum caucaseum]